MITTAKEALAEIDAEAIRIAEEELAQWEHFLTGQVSDKWKQKAQLGILACNRIIKLVKEAK